MNTRSPRILVGCTGSVASVKIPELIDLLNKLAFEPDVQLITTDNSRHFFDVKAVSCQVYTDKDEWEGWQALKDPILHIELRRWADIMLIAPLDANTLAKIANGMCDNLLTCVVRAWDLRRPLLFAPAMNTHMWDHPLTSQQIEVLKSLGFYEVPCIRKKLACGDTGMGAMAEVTTIISAVTKAVEKSRDTVYDDEELEKACGRLVVFAGDHGARGHRVGDPWFRVAEFLQTIYDMLLGDGQDVNSPPPWAAHNLRLIPKTHLAGHTCLKGE